MGGLVGWKARKDGRVGIKGGYKREIKQSLLPKSASRANRGTEGADGVTEAVKEVVYIAAKTYQLCTAMFTMAT